MVVVVVVVVGTERRRGVLVLLHTPTPTLENPDRLVETAMHGSVRMNVKLSPAMPQLTHVFVVVSMGIWGAGAVASVGIESEGVEGQMVRVEVMV